MPLSPEQKTAARTNATWAARTGRAASGFGLATQVLPPLGIPFGALFGAVGLLAMWRASNQEKLAADPPRDDYYSETTLEPAWIRTEGFGDSEIQAAGADFVRVTDELTRLFEAIVVAVERADGAKEDRDFANMQARTAEALAFATSAAEQLGLSRHHAVVLAQAIVDSGLPDGSELADALLATAHADDTYKDEIEKALTNGSFLEDPEAMGMGTGSDVPEPR